jgi:hypothetical protein
MVRKMRPPKEIEVPDYLLCSVLQCSWRKALDVWSRLQPFLPGFLTQHQAHPRCSSGRVCLAEHNKHALTILGIESGVQLPTAVPQLEWPSVFDCTPWHGPPVCPRSSIHLCHWGLWPRARPGSCSSPRRGRCSHELLACRPSR